MGLGSVVGVCVIRVWGVWLGFVLLVFRVCSWCPGSHSISRVSLNSAIHLCWPCPHQTMCCKFGLQNHCCLCLACRPCSAVVTFSFFLEIDAFTHSHCLCIVRTYSFLQLILCMSFTFFENSRFPENSSFQG